MMSYRNFALVVASVALAPMAIAHDQVPSDAELRSAYCITVLQRELADMKQIAAQVENTLRDPRSTAEGRDAAKSLAPAKKDMGDVEAALSRLQAYLVPRMTQRDPIALMAASKRGEADYQALMGGACTSDCMAAAPDRQNACVVACANSELVVRLRACRNPTWLPF